MTATEARPIAPLRRTRERAGLAAYRGRRRAERWWVGHRRRGWAATGFSELMALSRRDPRAAYDHALQTFDRMVPRSVHDHRRWFRRDGRGFGEDAFHAAWLLLFAERVPARAVEIGVYRGQTISLWALLAQLVGRPCEVHGISPFEAIGDSVSTYRSDLDYEAEVRDAFARFGLPAPTLVRALSTDPAADHHLGSAAWDLIYIDGNHEYEVAACDLALASRAIGPGGLIVVDDAAASLGYRPRSFAFAGHPGPSHAVAEATRGPLRLLGHVGHLVFLEPE